MKLKTIIAGSRAITSYYLIKNILDKINSPITEIISGTAIGPDKLGERYAEENGIKLTKFPAKWDIYGKSAGYIRNRQMAEYAKGGQCIIFWDGKSKGTKHMIDIAKEYKLKLKRFIIRDC